MTDLTDPTHMDRMNSVLDLSTRRPVNNFATFFTFQKYFIFRFLIVRHQFPLMIAYFRWIFEWQTVVPLW